MLLQSSCCLLQSHLSYTQTHGKHAQWAVSQGALTRQHTPLRDKYSWPINYFSVWECNTIIIMMTWHHDNGTIRKPTMAMSSAVSAHCVSRWRSRADMRCIWKCSGKCQVYLLEKRCFKTWPGDWNRLQVFKWFIIKNVFSAWPVIALQWKYISCFTKRPKAK